LGRPETFDKFALSPIPKEVTRFSILESFPVAPGAGVPELVIRGTTGGGVASTIVY